MPAAASACQWRSPFRPTCNKQSGQSPQRSSLVSVRSKVASAAPHPAQLRLGADIPIALKSVAVGDRRFWLVVPDIDAVMEMYIRSGHLDRDPFWCEPWPSALAMAEELMQRPHLVAGKTVCELGCGLGLAGLAAAAAGAAEVVLLDREPLALQCALLNASLNGLPTVTAPAAAAAGGGGSSSGVQVPSLEQLLPHLQAAEAEQLLEQQRKQQQWWQQRQEEADDDEEQQRQRQRRQSHAAASSSSDPTSSTSGSSSSSKSSIRGSARRAAPGLVRAEVFDWSQPVTLSRHDVMLVCDCLYEAYSVEPVAAVAPKLLKRSASRLLLADPPDRARHNRECFLDILCEEKGEFLLEESTEKRVPIWDDGKAAWRQVPIAMMTLRRSGGGGETVGVKLRREQGEEEA